MLRVILVHAGRIILPELGEKLGVYAQRKLVERNEEVHSNCKVTDVTDRDVTLSDGTTVININACIIGKKEQASVAIL